MTVIAYKAGRMACDALCVNTHTGTMVQRGNKIARTKVGALIGQSGDADARALLMLMDNVRSGEKIPPSKDLAETKCEGQFLVVFKSGHIWEINITPDHDMEEWTASAIPITGMGAIGSAGCGGELAMAFMMAGKTAKEAVAAVCSINAFCAPPIYVEELHRKSAPKPRKKRAKR